MFYDPLFCVLFFLTVPVLILLNIPLAFSDLEVNSFTKQ